MTKKATRAAVMISKTAATMIQTQKGIPPPFEDEEGAAERGLFVFDGVGEVDFVGVTPAVVGDGDPVVVVVVGVTPVLGVDAAIVVGVVVADVVGVGVAAVVG